MLYGGIKYERSGLYDRDRAGNYFRFIGILKLIKTILKLYDKFRKYEREMTLLLMWLNVSVTILIVRLQLLVLY